MQQRWLGTISSQVAGNGKRVLIATNVGLHSGVNIIDSGLSVGLNDRGARVDVLLCDSALPACMACQVNHFPLRHTMTKKGPKAGLCSGCFDPAADMWARLPVTLQKLGQWIEPADVEEAASLVSGRPLQELEHLTLDGISIGMHARASALRYYASGNLEKEPNARDVTARFAEAAILSARAANRILQSNNYDVCILHHGIYVPQGVFVEVANQIGVRVVTWSTGYRERCFIFSHKDTYHKTMLEESADVYRNLELSPEKETQLHTYMSARVRGTADWISYQSDQADINNSVRTQLKLDERPIVALFTNVIWDAQIFYASNAYASMLDWIMDTIKTLGERKDLQLVVRVHPAEIKNPMQSRQRVVKEVARVFAALPENVHVIGPEAPLNSYVLAKAANSAVIFGTKMGLELAYMGIPTIVAGEAWIRGKGLTHDVNSREAYLSLLEKIPNLPKMDASARVAAIRYAYHFFFRRMIPLSFIDPKKGWPPYELSDRARANVRPGKDMALDLVCQGILEGTPFVYPDEALSCGNGSIYDGPSTTY